MSSQPVPDNHLLDVRELAVWFPLRGGVFRRTNDWIRAVDGVSFHIEAGTTLALVGESGSGKTTTGRAIVRVQDVRRGEIMLAGESLTGIPARKLRTMRRRFQMIFQDPQSSLDPRQTVGATIGEPLAVNGSGSRTRRNDRVAELLEMVGLDASMARRYPHEFSGGQRQRIGIARAIALHPEFIVCDEPISALDVSIQAQIVNLLRRLQQQLGLTYLFIAHDLAVVRHMADRVAVMYLGQIVEIGEAGQVYHSPAHPYTAALLSAVPIPDAELERRRKRIILEGDLPSPANPPTGCRFHTRCWLRSRLGNPERCVQEEPSLRSVPGTADHAAACHFTDELSTEVTGALEVGS